MQGNPLRELILVLALVALMTPVILSLTADPEGVTPVRQNEEARGERVPVTVRLQFAHPPEKVELTHREVSVLKVERKDLEAPVEAQLEIDFSERSVEMPFAVKWPQGTPRTAVTVSFEPEGHDAKEVTFWGEGDLNEFIELFWNE